MSRAELPRVWHDFQAGTEDGRLVLSIVGTQESLVSLGLTLSEGLRLEFWCEDEDEHGVRDDLVAIGIVERDPIKGDWLARLEEPGVLHESDLPAA